MPVYIDLTAAVNGNGESGDTPRNTFPGTLVAGETYLFPWGMDWTAPANTQAIQVGQSGTAGARIVIGAYGDFPQRGKPTIRCPNVPRGVNFSNNVAFVTVQDLRITDLTGGATRRGVVNTTTGSSSTVVTSLTLQRLTIDNVQSDGSTDCDAIQIWGANNRVLHCDIDDIADDGIWYKGNNFEAAYNRITRIDRAGRATGDNIQCGGASDNGWIHHNHLDHSDSTVKQCFIHNTASTGLIFEFNECIGPSSGATFTTVLCSGIAGLKIRGNLMRGGANCHISPGSETAEIDSNILVNSYGRGIDLNAVGVKARNNIVFGVRAADIYGIRHTSALHTGCEAQNNVLIGWDRGIQATTGASASHNAFENCATNVNGIVSGGSDITAALLLSASYRPLPGSPLLRAGTHLGRRRDVAGVQRPNPPSIGAYDVATLR